MKQKSIINVRRSSICWRGRRELITDVRKPEIMVMTSLWAGSYLLITPITLKTCAKPKTQINRRRTLPASFPLVGCPPQAAWPERLLSPKSQDAVAYSRLRAWRFTLWLIVVISVRQSTIAAISGLHCQALVMVSSSIRPAAWLQNSKKRAERSERLMYEQESPRLSPLWLSASSSACHGLLIITVITPLPTKPARQNAQRTEAGERGNYWHADASAWCCCARCKIHEGVSWC